MKHIIIFFINLYQKLPLQSHKACRFIPTCSEYAIEAINTYGAFKGSVLAIKRIIRCRPGSSYGYDPVPEKEKV